MWDDSYTKMRAIALLLHSTILVLITMGFQCSKGGYKNIQPQFGPGCIYRCHCVDDIECDYDTGKCQRGCAAGWMGPGCQYGDIAYQKTAWQISNRSSYTGPENAVDGYTNTCSETQLMDEKWWRIDLNAVYKITGLVIYSSQPDALKGFEVRVGNVSSNSSADFLSLCFKHSANENISEVNHVLCTSEVVGKHLMIWIPGLQTRMKLCDVQIYGGRSLAYRRSAYQTSVSDPGEAFRAVDGGTNTQYWDYSCSHTNVEYSPRWRVDLAQVYNIIRIEFINRADCCAACPHDWFGLNCGSKCGHCASITCDHINGTCPSGCSEGYNGTRCLDHLQQDKKSSESSSALHIVIPVGGSLGAAGLIIMLILVAVIVWKRRYGAFGGKRHQSEEPDTKTSSAKFSSDIYKDAATLKLEQERSDVQPSYENSLPDKNIDREVESSVKNTEELGEKICIQMYGNAVADVEVMEESDTDETLVNSDVSVNQNVYYNTEISSKRGGKKIAVQDLSDYIKRGVHLSNDIEEEFKKLLSEPQHEMNIALKPRNRPKNRYKGMYAYDENRVILEPLSNEPDTDYINASFINGYKRDKAYIAAQGTITVTVNDFWRMIWQYDIQQIVMLTGLIEQGKQKCLQYWPNEGTNEYGMIRVELTDEDVCAEYAIRSFLLSKTGSKKQKKANQFHFTSWPDRGVPDTASALVQFWKKVRDISNTVESPILVHCSAGIGRTGTYIALDFIFDEGSEEGYVNIFDCINTLREQRVGLVQTTEQYVYLHEVILEAFKDTEAYISVDDFQKYYAEMGGNDPGSEQTKLLNEFENLQEEEHIYFGRAGMGVTRDTSSDRKDEFLDGKLPENKTKNRCNNILPSERYRPYLSMCIPGRNDYINAVCLPTRKNRKGLLVTQMPLPDTVIDFWRLVFDYDVQSIVMLNEANIPGEEVGVYWPEKSETSKHGPFVVKITSNTEKSSHMERMLQVSKHGEGQTLSLKQFVCSFWRLHDSVPKSTDGFLNLIEDVEDWKRHSGERPILVHCLNGAERSGLFCVLWCALEKMKSDREVAIRSIVRQMRIRRQHIIPSFEQYKFCHEVVLFSLNNSATYANI